MRKVFILLINLYRVFVSPILVTLFGHGCRYTPTCSEYAQDSIEKYGVITGGYLAVKRILRCNPINKHTGYDPVPIMR